MHFSFNGPLVSNRYIVMITNDLHVGWLVLKTLLAVVADVKENFS